MSETQPVLVPGATDAPIEAQPEDETLMPGVELADPVFVPEAAIAPHGAAAKAASDFATMTTAEVLVGVKAGTINLGHRQNVLCRDGYLCNPNAS